MPTVTSATVSAWSLEACFIDQSFSGSGTSSGRGCGCGCAGGTLGVISLSNFLLSMNGITIFGCIVWGVSVSGSTSVGVTMTASSSLLWFTVLVWKSLPRI